MEITDSELEAEPLPTPDCVCCDCYRLDLTSYPGRRGRRYFRLLDERPYMLPVF